MIQTDGLSTEIGEVTWMNIDVSSRNHSHISSYSRTIADLFGGCYDFWLPVIVRTEGSDHAGAYFRYQW